MGVKVSGSEELVFQRIKETFRDRIVPVVTATAHALYDPMCLQDRAVVMTGVLTTSVRVFNQSRRRLPRRERALQRGEREVRLERRSRRPAHHAVRGEM